MGTGKAKFEYEDGENLDGKMKTVKKVETKEASRTLGNGSNFRKGGLPKPRAHSKANINIKENVNEVEIQVLREKNEEYRKALNVFRNKLNEVAVFNSNLAYATRLFTEHSTSKQEKINILRRFDSVETLKESKNLYKSIKEELSTTTNNNQSINESIERKIENVQSTGSSINLIESKTYENPQFLRMKDLMTKLK
jgi:DNA repair ATPase RecN